MFWWMERNEENPVQALKVEGYAIPTPSPTLKIKPAQIKSPKKRQILKSVSTFDESVSSAINGSRRDLAACFTQTKGGSATGTDVSWTWGPEGQLLSIIGDAVDTEATQKCLWRISETWKISIHAGQSDFSYSTYFEFSDGVNRER